MITSVADRLVKTELSDYELVRHLPLPLPLPTPSPPLILFCVCTLL